MKQKVNLLIGVLLSLVLTACAGQTSYAYDREEAVFYARMWAGEEGIKTSNIDPVYKKICNMAVYGKRYGSDCSHFVSQCLIAGGVRFRGDIEDPNDNIEIRNGKTDPKAWEGGQYLYGAWTFEIVNPDRRKYSRVVPAAEHLGHRSFASAIHGGITYGPFRNHLPAPDHPVWSRVKPGDLLFKALPEGNYEHAMLISDVRGGEIRYCAHSSDHTDKELSVALSQYPGEPFYIVCVPDAPLITQMSVKSNGLPVMLKGNTRFPVSGTDPSGRKYTIGNKGDLVINIKFDTPMAPTLGPLVSLLTVQSSGIAPLAVCTPYPGGVFGQDGWDAKHKSWRGRISATLLPDGMNTLCWIYVSAGAADLSALDSNNELSVYVPGECLIAGGVIDTRRTKGKN